MNQAVRPMAQPNAAVTAASVRFNQTARNVIAQPQASHSVASPARLAAGEHVESQTSSSPSQQPQQKVATTDEEAYRQALGDKLYVKVQMIDPEMAAKYTGMLLTSGTSECERMLVNDEFLHSQVSSALFKK